MIEYRSTSIRGFEKVHIIYEKHEDPPRGKRIIPYHSMRHAMRGEYVRDHAGKCVPVLYRRTLKRADGSRETMLVFPGHCWLEHKHASRPFVWSEHAKTHRTALKPKHRFFAQLLSVGVEEVEAYHRAFPSIPKKAIPYKLVALYANKDFIVLYLQESGLMATLKDVLKEKNITPETMVDRLVQIMDEETTKENQTLKKMAIEKLWDAVMEPEKKIPAELPQGRVDLTHVRAEIHMTSHKSLPEGDNLRASSGVDGGLRFLEEGDAEVVD